MTQMHTLTEPSTPPQGASVHLVSGDLLGEFCVYRTRTGMHHFQRVAEKKLLCRQTKPTYLEMFDILETRAEVEQLVNEPANERYLCQACRRKITAILSSPNTKVRDARAESGASPSVEASTE